VSDLEDRLRSALAARADDTTVTAARFDRRTVADEHGRRRRVPVAATAAVAVAAAGAGALIAVRHDGHTPSTEPPAPAAGEQPVGLFPRGGIDEVLSAGYRTPEAVVQAYLDDRTRPEHVPRGSMVAAHVADLGPSVDASADRVVVGFEIEALGESDAGFAEVVRVEGHDGSEAWAVTAAFAGLLEIPTMTLDGDELNGWVWGRADPAAVEVRETWSGADAARGRVDGDELASYGYGPGRQVSIDDLDASNVDVTVWFLHGDDQASATFGEFVLREGEAAATGTMVLSNQARDAGTVFAHPQLTGFAGAADASVARDPGAIFLRGYHAVDEGTYCVDVSGAMSRRRDCWPISWIAAGQAIASGDDGLVYGIVPDGATVSRADGETVFSPPTGNVWYDLGAALGGQQTYLIEGDDVRTMAVTPP